MSFAYQFKPHEHEGRKKLTRQAGCCRMEVTASNFRLGAHQFYARNGMDQAHRYFCKSL